MTSPPSRGVFTFDIAVAVACEGFTSCVAETTVQVQGVERDPDVLGMRVRDALIHRGWAYESLRGAPEGLRFWQCPACRFRARHGQRSASILTLLERT